MPHQRPKHYAKKHGPDAVADEAISKALLQRAPKGTIACAVAFDVAKNLGETPAAIGRTADLLELRLIKCQLGLFGYGPKKKVKTPMQSVPSEIQKAVVEALEAGRLPCKKAWEIAETFAIHKLKMGANCDAMGVKVAPCQLGAF